MVMKITIMASYTFLIIENIKNKIFNKIYLAIVLGETGQIFKYYLPREGMLFSDGQLR